MRDGSEKVGGNSRNRRCSLNVWWSNRALVLRVVIVLFRVRRREGHGAWTCRFDVMILMISPVSAWRAPL